MTRKRTSSSNSRRNRESSKTNTILWIILALIALVAIIIAIICINPNKHFTRATLDKYIEITYTENKLGNGASVYFDMSDGMNLAYSDPLHRKIHQAVIDRLAANDAIDFFTLADGEISSIEKSHTELYNYMIDSHNYLHQKAPIEKTLKTIVEKQQPALLMSDFEEYKGGLIERAAYAKRYFIDWLSKGYTITFYKWDFIEGNIKHMFLAVFDDNANRLNGLIKNAIYNVYPEIETYILGGHGFAFPTSSKYISHKKGGNYHNSKGEDIVTAVLEDGSGEAYKSYAQPYATANGTPGEFTRLNQLVGSLSEYYPIGVDWKNALENSKIMQQVGIPQEDVFTHLLSHLYLDFEAQDGYEVDEVEVRVFDMHNTMEYLSNRSDSCDIKSDQTKLNTISNPEVFEILKASMHQEENANGSWKHICVDFDDHFNGSFPQNVTDKDLLRANIVISKVHSKLEEVDSFFGWQNNFSLAKSVKETLSASTSNLEGKILFTYYLKSL